MAAATVAVRRANGRAGAALLLAEHCYRYARRALELRRLLAASDAVIVQRGAYPVGPSALLTCLQRFSGRVVYDLDDAIFLPTPTLAHRSALARWVYRTVRRCALLERADTVVVSTPELEQALPGRRPTSCCRRSPTCGATRARSSTGTPRCGSAGSAPRATSRYLDPLREVLGRLAEDGVAELEVVSTTPWEGPARFRRWRAQDEAEAVAGFEVGVMPFPDTPYTRAKAGFKLLQYMAAGCAVIASPVGANRGLVESPGAGCWRASPTNGRQPCASWPRTLTAVRSSGAGSALRARVRRPFPPRRCARRAAPRRDPAGNRRLPS